MITVIISIIIDEKKKWTKYKCKINFFFFFLNNSQNNISKDEMFDLFRPMSCDL